MRRTLIAIAGAAALAALGSQTASAADGCSYGPRGELYCAPGASPGVPYGYYGGSPYEPYYREPYYQPDPGRAIAVGIIGAAAGAIISHQRYRHHWHYR